MFIKLTSVADPSSPLKANPPPRPIVVNTDNIAFIRPYARDPNVTLVQFNNTEYFYTDADFNALADILMEK